MNHTTTHTDAMMKRYRQLLVGPLLAAMLAAGAAPAMAETAATAPAAGPTATASAAAQGADAAFASWSDDFAAQWIRLSPERATASQYFSGQEQAALDRQLTPDGKERRAQVVALAKTGLCKVDQYLACPLGVIGRTSAETMRWSLARTFIGEHYK